ncbi:hypothetical protein [Pseudofulvibacter geojedonensis]|uniref:NlpE C-terminal OB domain-containing protein n=1 Tax=Pseudofulvibacter geojedonensis TaxID=1123758 RepID=A0ABW3I3K9_9FLAO
MKQVLVILIALIGFVSCKKEAKVETQEINAEAKIEKPTPIYTGDFLAVDGSAIITMGNETYKVIMNDACKELIEKSKTFQKEPFDFVKISVKGDIADNPNENEWKKTLTITSIENVSKSTTEENITIVK